MAKISNAEYRAIIRKKKELFKLILKRTGVTQDEVLLPIIQRFINQNCDVLTASELEEYKGCINVRCISVKE